MGSQYAVRRRDGAESRRNGPDALTGEFEKYMREITPAYPRDAEEGRAQRRPHDREKQFRVHDREAMYFFSESHMR